MRSLKALGSGEGVQVERLKRLLAYWVCMGALQMSEACLMPLVGGSGVVPKHYNVARLIAIYWMQGGDFSHSTDIYCRLEGSLFVFAPSLYAGKLIANMQSGTFSKKPEIPTMQQGHIKVLTPRPDQ